jgi:hypothetical protein
MAENSLTGAIPSFIGRLTALQFLYVLEAAVSCDIGV